MGGLNKIVGIKADVPPNELRFIWSNLKRGLSRCYLTPKSKIESRVIKDFKWLRGFIEGEGYFLTVVQESRSVTTKTLFSVSLRFTLTQHSRDALLKSIVDYLGCGRYRLVSGRDEGCFIVSNFWYLSERKKLFPY